MEQLFRLVLTRPPREPDKKGSISTHQDTPFQHNLDAASKGDNPKQAAKAAAQEYASSTDFVSDPSDLKSGPALEELSSGLDALGDLSKAAADKIEELFKAAIEELKKSDVTAAVLASERLRLIDSILTIKLLPVLHELPIERLVTVLRHLLIMEIMEESGGEIARDGKQITMLRSRPLELPDSLLPPPAFKRKPVTGRPPREDDKERDAEFAQLLNRYLQTRTAANELTGLSSKSLSVTMQRESAALTSSSVTLAPERRGFFPRLFASTQPGTARRAFDPRVNDTAGFRLTSEGAGQLSGDTRQALSALGVDVTRQSLDNTVSLLKGSLQIQAAELDQRHPLLSRSNAVVASEAVSYMAPSYGEWAYLSTGYAPRGHVLSGAAGSIPTTHGTIEPAGVADLLVVKQQLIRYEATDIAHVENVLQGEGLKRVHRRTQTTEQTLLTETETTTSDEHDLESTERFEVTKEADSVIKTDAALQAGVTVSGKYGPVVEFSASAQGAVAVSKQEATKHAENYSRDVTMRSSKKVTERVLQREVLKITNEIEETNEHSIDNTNPGGANVIGIYQWVEKIYQAQIFNYGLRTLFDFMVPEPAAFTIAALKASYAQSTDLKKPAVFTLRPSDITETNYGYWALQYEATGLKPPPEPFRTATAIGKAAGIANDGSTFTDAQQISIDEGYEAIYAYVGQTSMLWDLDQFAVDVVIGSRSHRFDKNTGWVWGTSLDSEQGSVPLAVTTFMVSDIAVAVEVKCRRTNAALDKWRADTHATLLLAYQKKISEYEEKLQQLKDQAGVAISGRNPASNLELINGELKKICTSILSQQHYDLFGAVETGTNGLPQTLLSEAQIEGP